MRSICVFTGSSPGTDPAYADAAHELGTLIAQRGMRLVYGGGSVGLMGIVADAALAAGGTVIGVIPEHLLSAEVGHHHLSELHVTTSMHERKALMSQLSDGFVAMPGGFGTLEEIVEILTWTQLGLLHKPVGFLDVGGFYEPLMAYFERLVEQGFVRAANLRLYERATTPTDLVDALERRESGAGHDYLELT